jgi:UDPglucose 6-dehydrogenase
VHDPEAMENVRTQYGKKLTYCEKPMQALDGADALAIMTEWGDYQRPEFKEMLRRMRAGVVFDGRNLYEPTHMKRLGFVYHSIGRPAV